MPFAVEFHIREQADIAVTVGRLAKRGGTSADRWRTGLMTAVLSRLEADPRRCPVADESDDLGLDLRELLYGRKPNVYRVLFTINGGTVFVHRVRHAARDRLGEGDV